MKAEDSQMMNILYSPLMYTHSDCLSLVYSSTNILSDVIFNNWIIEKYQLSHLPEYWQPTDPISLLIVSNWHIIPEISYLIGSYILREKILIDSVIFMNDIDLLNFISLPLKHTIKNTHEYENINFSVLGVAFIISVAKKLPTALQQRLYLFFSPDVNIPKLQIAVHPDNINLLKMAIIYARNSSK